MADIEPAGGVPAPSALARAVRWINARLAEPGTHRSLAVLLFAIHGGVNSTEAWEAAIHILIGILASWSAASPEPAKAVAVTDVQMDTGTAIQILARAAVAAEAREAGRS